MILVRNIVSGFHSARRQFDGDLRIFLCAFGVLICLVVSVQVQQALSREGASQRTQAAHPDHALRADISPTSEASGPVLRPSIEAALPTPIEPELAADEIIEPKLSLRNAHLPAATGDSPTPPLLALIIDDLGISEELTRRAIELDAPLTLSFLPYASHTKVLARRAYAAGKEIMVHLPMEPMGFSDPGPSALKVSDSKDEILRKIVWSLSRVEGFAAVNNHMGSRFTADAARMRVVMKELARRNALYVDSRTGPRPTAVDGRIAGYNVLVRDVFLDHRISKEAVAAQIKLSERIAREKGHAVVIGHPHALTLDMVDTWIADAEEKGFKFVSVTYLADMLFAPDEPEEPINIASTIVRSEKSEQIERLLLPRELALSLY